MKRLLPVKGILVVDDEPMVQELLRETLGRLGLHNVHCVSSGGEALAFVDEVRAPVGVVICDLQMPEMDGVELLRHMGRRGFGGAVVLISGVDDHILRSAERVAGAYHLNVLGSVAKPVTHDALRRLLRPLLDSPVAEVQTGVARQCGEDEIMKGLQLGEFSLHYQPKVSLVDGSLCGVEALARWHHPRFGMVSPAAFIPVAERGGVIEPLTKALYRVLLRQLVAWRDAGRPLKAAFNLSMGCCRRVDLPDQLAQWAAEEGAVARDLVFEVTEGALSDDPASTLDVLTRLALKGFELSIDDFGTGYSSLERLHQIPFSELKVDRGFVVAAQHDASARAILESSVELGRKLGLRLVAEGVESEAQRGLVSSLGCDLAQGYLFARPMPAEELDRWRSPVESRVEA